MGQPQPERASTHFSNYPNTLTHFIYKNNKKVQSRLLMLMTRTSIESRHIVTCTHTDTNQKLWCWIKVQKNASVKYISNTFFFFTLSSGFSNNCDSHFCSHSTNSQYSAVRVLVTYTICCCRRQTLQQVLKVSDHGISSRVSSNTVIRSSWILCSSWMLVSFKNREWGWGEGRTARK